MSRIVERVRALLAASKSDNEHEAALAAQRAAELMAKYNLEEAHLRIEDETRVAEEIKERVLLDDTQRQSDRRRKRVAWKEMIADGVAKSLGCHLYLTADGPAVFGREGATQAWRYTCEYLFNEVNRLADEAWEEECLMAAIAGHTIKKWKNSFRVGCAQSIMMRLYEVGKPKPVSSNEKALMIIDDDAKEVDAQYRRLEDGMGKASMIGLVSNRTGYKAGLDAGQDVQLGGGTALPEGQRSLT